MNVAGVLLSIIEVPTFGERGAAMVHPRHRPLLLAITDDDDLDGTGPLQERPTLLSSLSPCVG